MTQGIVKVSLNIRALPSKSSPALGGLAVNDVVTGIVDATNWIKLETWKRGGVSMTLPAADCYASAGANEEYIDLQDVTPPPTGEAVVQVVHEIMVDGITYAPASGNPISFIKKA